VYLENYSSDFHQISFRTISAILTHYIQISAQTVENWETSSNHKICTYIWNSENAIFVFRVVQNFEKIHSRAQLLIPIVKQYPPFLRKVVKSFLRGKTAGGSWGPIKQHYIGGFSRSIRRGEFFTPKVWDSFYFCLIFSFVMISMKIFETYRIDWYNWRNYWDFF